MKKVFIFTESKERREEKPDAEGFKWSMLDFDWDEDVKAQVCEGKGLPSTPFVLLVSTQRYLFQPTRIRWKSGKNLCQKYPKDGDDDDFPDELGSFFNWFELPSDANEVFAFL